MTNIDPNATFEELRRRNPLLAVINMKDAPKKLRNAAKIAKKLIERKKKLLNID